MGKGFELKDAILCGGGPAPPTWLVVLLAIGLIIGLALAVDEIREARRRRSRSSMLNLD